VPFEFLEDASIADVAFRAWGPDIGTTFVAAAQATLAVMVEDLASVRPAVQRTLRLERESLDMLLFAFLNEIVFVKDAERLLLCAETAQLEITPERCRLTATASGEVLDETRHATRVDVKAVTLHRFSLQESARGWEAHVTLDV
jgi:SHS2 domain-containing protein